MILVVLSQLSHLTGSTAQVFLEYVQRNLPEGVAMEVTKVRVRYVWATVSPSTDIVFCIDVSWLCVSFTFVNHQTAIEKVPGHILEPMWEDNPADEKPSQWSLRHCYSYIIDYVEHNSIKDNTQDFFSIAFIEKFVKKHHVPCQKWLVLCLTKKKVFVFALVIEEKK